MSVNRVGGSDLAGRSSHEERGLKYDAHVGRHSSCGRSSHEERGLKFDGVADLAQDDRVAPRMRSVD